MKRRGLSFLAWELGLLALLLSVSFSACSLTFNSTCAGKNVSCGNVGSTILSPDSTAQAIAVATANALQQQKPLASDPMNSQDNNRWANNENCFFYNGTYFAAYNSGGSNGTLTCHASAFNYRDAAIQMDVIVISGNSAGIMFRSTPGMSEFYEFMIGSGRFALGLFQNNDTSTILIPPTSTDAIRGWGEPNRLLVIAKGDDFQLFINGTFVGETHDTTLTTGYVGVSLAYNPSAQARFSHLVIYPD